MSVRPGPLSEARKKAMVDEIQVGNRLKDRSDWSRQDKVVLSAVCGGLMHISSSTYYQHSTT